MWKVVTSVLAVSMAALLPLLLGLIWFLHQAEASTKPLSARADVIVAFSGDPRRIRAAGRLLADGHAHRLLIVGQDNSDEVSALRARYPNFSACCIARIPFSRTTTQDAYVAGQWVRSKRAQSVILVTSDFHIPRATAELGRQLPSILIVPCGVKSGDLKLGSIFGERSAGAPSLLREYFKFASASIPGLHPLMDTSFARETARWATTIGYRKLGGYSLLLLEVATVIFTLLRWPVTAKFLRNLRQQWKMRNSKDKGESSQ